MNHREIAAIVAGVVPVVKEYVAKGVAEISARVDALEARPLPTPAAPDHSAIAQVVMDALSKIPPAPAGKDADPAVIRVMVVEEVAKIPPAADGKSVTVDDVRPMLQDMVASLPKPADGKSLTLDEVRPLIEEAVAALPPAADGKSVTVDDVRPMLQDMVASLPKPADGKSVDPADVRLMVAVEVARIPPAADGKSVTVDDVRPVIKELVDQTVASLPKPKDGVGVAGAVIDRNGILVLTLSDGSTKELGVVVGKDADRAEIVQLIADEIAKFPKPKDGKDGLGFDDLTVTHDGERKFTLRFIRGEEVKEFSFDLAVPLDRGVWKEGCYAKGDGVSHGGSWWIAQCDTAAKPDISRDWRLSVKRGRDGKDGKPGERGERGLKGDPGIDRR
jgi:hypothetical protein